jgi:tetratricopeptide (TPR) repeat protein
MKLKLYTVLFLVITSLLISCRSAKKMYAKGNYDEAVELAAKKLQKKPNDAATLDILKNAYRFAVEDHESRIRNNDASNNGLRWEWTYKEYVDLQRLYDAIRRVPAVYDIVRPTDYSSYVVTFKEEAGNARYERGLELMAMNSRNSYKQAYYEFQKSLALKPGDIQTKLKMDEAYSGAVTNVVVLAIVQSGYQYSSYQSFTNFDYDMLRYLNNNSGNIFVRYYSPAEANTLDIRTDQVVEMRFDRMDIDYYRDQKTTREVSKEVLVKETVIKPDSVIKEYATVKAKVTTTRRTLEADGGLQVTVRDHNGQWIWSDTYRDEYDWTTEFSTYTGDSRALTEEDKKLINRKETFPPRNDEIAEIIMNEIRSRAECGIRDYFNR